MRLRKANYFPHFHFPQLFCRGEWLSGRRHARNTNLTLSNHNFRCVFQLGTTRIAGNARRSTYAPSVLSKFRSAVPCEGAGGLFFGLFPKMLGSVMGRSPKTMGVVS